jgi:ketosteroid isomerase-like protein
MSSEDSKRTVVAALEALKTRDPERIAAVFSEDAEWLAPANNATAVALNGPSHMVGRNEIARLMGTEVWKLFTANVKGELRGIYVDGKTVVVEHRMRATLSDGNPYDNEYCFVFEVENGLIRSVREYMDTAKGHRMIFGAR